jgi:predicted phosphodiesterase
VSFDDSANTSITNQNNSAMYKALVVGDLHVSDKYSGRHVDYFRDCVEFLQQITDEMENNKVTHLFLTGDLIGRTTEKNLQSRDSLLYFMKVLQIWNQMTNGHVYSNRGNHDFAKNLTDFEFFVSMGLIKTDDFVDVGAVRFHLIDWGDHTRAVTISEDKYNVAIMHTNLQVEGITTWFRGGNDGVELSTLENLYGIEFVIAGHIHNPSIRVVETSIRDKSVQLFYPGNASRPRYEPNIWEKCFGVLFDTDDKDVSLGQVEFKLRPQNEIFQSTYDDLEEEDLVDDAPTFNIEQLSSILDELKNYNILGEADYKTQVIKLGGIDKEAVELALNYIEKVEGEMK